MRIKLRRVFGLPSRVVCDAFAWLFCCCLAAVQEALHVDGAIHVVKHSQEQAETRDDYLGNMLQKAAKQAKKDRVRQAKHNAKAKKQVELEKEKEALEAPVQVEMIKEESEEEQKEVEQEDWESEDPSSSWRSSRPDSATPSQSGTEASERSGANPSEPEDDASDHHSEQDFDQNPDQLG